MFQKNLTLTLGSSRTLLFPRPSAKVAIKRRSAFAFRCSWTGRESPVELAAAIRVDGLLLTGCPRASLCATRPGRDRSARIDMHSVKLLSGFLQPAADLLLCQRRRAGINGHPLRHHNTSTSFGRRSARIPVSGSHPMLKGKHDCSGWRSHCSAISEAIRESPKSAP